MEASLIIQLFKAEPQEHYNQNLNNSNSSIVFPILTRFPLLTFIFNYK